MQYINHVADVVAEHEADNEFFIEDELEDDKDELEEDEEEGFESEESDEEEEKKKIGDNEEEL